MTLSLTDTKKFRFNRKYIKLLDKKLFVEVRDHSVSKESFRLYHDEDLDLLITEPKPSVETLGSYYQSEDYISHTDSKRTAFEKVYHLVKSFSINQKLSFLEKVHPAKGILLDIGAGTGEFLAKATKKNWNVLGYEPDSAARKIAIGKGINLCEKLAELENNSVDVITMWHVLEHVYDYDQQIVELKRILKKEGVIIVAVPNFKSFDANYYKKSWAAFDAPRHLWHFSKTSIKKIFENHGINLVDVHPMYFDSFYVSLLSEKYKNGKMNVLKGIVVGLISNIKGMKSGEYSSHIYVLRIAK